MYGLVAVAERCRARNGFVRAIREEWGEEQVIRNRVRSSVAGIIVAEEQREKGIEEQQSSSAARERTSSILRLAAGSIFPANIAAPIAFTFSLSTVPPAN
jgi:hypothetical protein